VESVDPLRKNWSPRSDRPKVKSPVGDITELGALPVKLTRQFELGGIAVMSETVIFATRIGLLDASNSVEYLIERTSSGSSTGRTTRPPTWLLPPSRTSRRKSTTCDPSVE
jgi:hypothetical protein